MKGKNHILHVNFNQIKQQINDAIQVQKMISDIKHTFNYHTYDGYLLVLDTIRFDRIKQNTFIKGNIKDLHKESHECVFNIIFDENMHISDLTYDSEKQCLNVAAIIATDIFGIIKEYFDYKTDLSPIRVDFIVLHDSAVRALELGEAHLFNVKDENTTTSKSVIHGFEKDKKLFAFEPNKFL